MTTTTADEAQTDEQTDEGRAVFANGEQVTIDVEMPTLIDNGKRISSVTGHDFHVITQAVGELFSMELVGVVLLNATWLGEKRERLMIPWTQVKALY